MTWFDRPNRREVRPSIVGGVPRAQLTLDAIEARDEAMARVAFHSAPWSSIAVQALQQIATERRSLSSEDVWERLDQWRIPRPVEPRALGPVMVRGVKAGWIVAAGWTQSTDPKSHRDPMRVYRSLL